MEKDRLTYKTLARYLAEECTPRDKQKVEQWLDDSPFNTQKLEEFQYIWKMSKETDQHYEEFDAKGGWKALNDRLDEEAFKKQAKEKRDKFRSARRSIHSTASLLMRFAAIFLITGFVGFFAYQNLYQPEPVVNEPAVREISTNKGQRVNLTLADGTKVLLNAESKIILPVHFKQDVREVFLQGQAYFNVTPNPDKPFLIHAEGSVVRVLGTSFSVRSYPEGEQVLVAVKEGKVSFETEGSKAYQQTILTKGQLGRYTLDGHKMESEQPENMDRYLGWIKGYLTFDQTSMEDVATTLERRYNVEVVFRDAEIKNMKVTAHLKSRMVKNVLNVITRSLGINYHFKDGQVTFFKDG